MDAVTQIMEATLRGQANAPRTRELLDSLSARELRVLELNLRELEREVMLAQVRQGA